MSTAAVLESATVRRQKRISTVVLFAAAGGFASLLNAQLFEGVSKAFSLGHVGIIRVGSLISVLVLSVAGIVFAAAICVAFFIALRLKVLPRFSTARFRRPALGSVTLAGTAPASLMAVLILGFVASFLLEWTLPRSTLGDLSETTLAMIDVAVLVVFLGTYWLVKVYLSSLALRLALTFQPCHLWLWTLVGAGIGLLVIWLAQPQLETHGWAERLALVDGPALGAVLGWWVFQGTSISARCQIAEPEQRKAELSGANG